MRKQHTKPNPAQAASREERRRGSPSQQDPPAIEQHHVAGRNNHPLTVPVHRNNHRILTTMQYSWPERTRTNPDGSPLLQAAAVIRGWLDILALVIDTSVGWIPEMLEAMDEWLREKLGPQYWDEVRRWLREQPEKAGLVAYIEGSGA